MTDENIKMSFQVGEGYRELFRSVARWHGVPMAEMLRDWVMERGNEIAGPFTITATDKSEAGDRASFSSSIQLQAMELSIAIEEKIEQERIENEEALAAVRKSAEDAKKARQQHVK